MSNQIQVHAREWNTREATHELIDELTRYWARRGYEFRGVPYLAHQGHDWRPIWGIKSNIGANGFPPRDSAPRAR